MFLFLVVLSSFTRMNDCRLGGLLLEEEGKKTCAALTSSGNGKVFAISLN